MTKYDNNKKVSRLTGSLLARKGTASPSPAPGLSTPAIQRFAPAEQNQPVENNGQTKVKNIAARTKIKHKTEAANTKKKTRVAMTLRMEEESHLKLRLFSAHSRKSCQTILSEALDLYLSEHAEELELQKCACLAE